MNRMLPRARWPWVGSPSLLLLALLLAQAPFDPAHGLAAQAQATVQVRYDPALNTIFVGESYSDPALAAYPSAPGAPKTPISIPQIAAALSNPALLQDQGGGAWLLHADLVINPSAQLDVSNATISRHDRGFRGKTLYGQSVVRRSCE